MTPLHVPSAIVETLGWVLVHSVWELALIAVVALGSNWAMRRCSAKARYAMLVVALAAMLAAPIATLLALPQSQPTPAMIYKARLAAYAAQLADDLGPADRPAPAELAPASAAGMLQAPGEDATVAAGDQTSDDASRDGGSTSDRQSGAAWRLIVCWWSKIEIGVRVWSPQIVGLWCLGVFVFAWRPVFSLRELGRLRRVGVSPVPERVRLAAGDLARRMRLSRAVQIVESTRIQVPAVVGYLRPMILLPVSLVSQLPVPQLEAILGHELAHIRRHDYLVNLWQILTETVLFYHPAVWWLSRRIRVERENCCDDVAVALAENRVEYGRALLAVAELRGPQTALALGADGGSLTARIARLFAGQREHRALDSGNLVALGLLTASIVAAAIWATAVAKEPGDGVPVVAVAEEDAEPATNFVDVVTDRFAAALEKLELPYVTPQALTILRTELHDYLAARITKPPTGTARTKVLKAVDSYVRNKFSAPEAYRQFHEHFDMLKWQLWTAADRRELTLDEIKVRERQRNWMRDYIRSLPEETQAGQKIPEYSVEGRLIMLESVIYGNPLSPFFHEPMSAEEFEQFKQRFLDQQKKMSGGHLISAPDILFTVAVFLRVESLRERWPPGFPVGGLSAGTGGFNFRRKLFDYDGGSWLLDERGSERHYFDVAQDRTIAQPAPLDEPATQRWLAESKEGDLWFDKATQRLIAVRGARLAALEEADWYAADQISLADLRKRLADKPLESYSLATVATIPVWDARYKTAFAKLPIFALESADGKVTLFRIANHLGDSVALVVRPRPLPPYPPFAVGDVEYQEGNH